MRMVNTISVHYYFVGGRTWLNAAFFSKEVKTIRNEEAAFLYDLLGLYNIPIPEYEVRESAQDKKEYIRGELNKVHAFLG